MIGVQAMRRIDFWLGIPLCALLTVVTRLARLLPRRSTRPVQPRRMLFIELSEMGSAILADPAMRLARVRYGVEPYFLIFARNRDSLRLGSGIDPANIRTIATDSLPRFVLDTVRAIAWTHREGIDTTVDFELFSRFTALFARLTPASRRAGFHRFHGEGLYRGNLLTHRIAYNPHRHISENFAALVAGLGDEPNDEPHGRAIPDDLDLAPPRAVIDPAAAAQTRALLDRLLPPPADGGRRLVLVHPNCGDLLPQRRWPATNYAQLIGRLLASDPRIVVGIIGGAEDRRTGRELVASLADPRCADLTGELPLGELPTLFAESRLLVSNDSGPAHFASTTALPTIVLFGPETPVLYHPLGPAVALYAGLPCSPCVSAQNHRRTPCRDNACMRAITVDAVFEAAQRALNAGTVTADNVLPLRARR